MKKTAAAVVALAWLGASCTGPKDPMPTEPTGEAMFDNLTYVGNDSYYAEHPLAGETEFYNPLLPGFFSDPAICSNGKGDYYLVTSTFTYFPGVPIFHSRDLVNWRQIGHVLSRESQLVNMVGQHVSGGIFAPGLSYNPKTGTYYMLHRILPDHGAIRFMCIQFVASIPRSSSTTMAGPMW